MGGRAIFRRGGRRGAGDETWVGQSHSKSVLFTPQRLSSTMGALERLGGVGACGRSFPATQTKGETQRQRRGLGSHTWKGRVPSLRTSFEEWSRGRESMVLTKGDCPSLGVEEAMIHCGEWLEGPFNQHTQCLFLCKRHSRLEVSFLVSTQFTAFPITHSRSLK